MSRLGTLLMAVGIVSALLAVPFGVAAVAADEPNVSVAPGERLAGIVGIQQAAVDSDLTERTYAARLDRANSGAERAAIVDERRAEIERRLAAHEADLAELRAARQAGNITEGTYRSRVATLAAEKGSTERAAEQASETARELPAAVREARGISVEDLQRLRADVNELGGPETATIAREIGGPNADRPTVGPRKGGPEVSTPRRNLTDRELSGNGRSAGSADRPTEPGERPVGERPTESGERPADDRPTESNGNQADDRPTEPGDRPVDDGQPPSPNEADRGTNANDPTTRQRGTAAEPTDQGTLDRNGPPESTDRQGGAAGNSDNRGSNGQRPSNQ